MPVRRTEHRRDHYTPYKSLKQAPMAAVMSPRAHAHAHMGWPLDHQTTSHSWSSLPHFHSPPTNGYPPPETVVMSIPSSSNVQAYNMPPRRSSPTHVTAMAENPWTSDMDAILIDAQARGLKWEQISHDYFPHKSANACRKRFGRAKEERRVNDWDERRISQIILAYNREGMREKMWSLMTRETGEKWQDIERWCFSQGLLKMTKGRNGHNRRRSTTPRQGVTMIRNNSRYNSVSNDEYDGSDENTVNMSLHQTQTYLPTTSSQVALPPLPTATGASGPMLHPDFSYPHAS